MSLVYNLENGWYDDGLYDADDLGLLDTSGNFTTNSITGILNGLTSASDTGNNDDFLRVIGIDPDKLRLDKTTSPSNKQILKDIGYTGDSTVDDIGKFIKQTFLKPDGSLNLKTLPLLAGPAMAMMGLNNSSVTPVGYQGTIPEYTASRNMMTAPPTGRRPGSSGIDYGGGVTYKNKDGSIASSNESSLPDLLAAARNNPFSESQTNYGIAPVPATGAADKQTFATPATQTKAVVDTAKTPEDLAKKAGLTLPSDWSTYTTKQKIDWFNKNNVDASKLASAGISEDDINWMKQNGYTGNAAGVPLPADWTTLNPKQKIDYFNKNNVGVEALKKAGTTPEDIAWMKKNGYTGNAAGVVLPDGFENKTPQQKIEWFNENNIGEAALALSGSKPEDIAWMKKNGYTGTAPVAATPVTTPAATTPAAVTPAATTAAATTPAATTPAATTSVAGLTLPADFANRTPEKKIEYFNQNNVGIDALTKAGSTADDIQWMKDHGYTGNAAGVVLPTGFENKTPQQKIEYFNQNNVGIDALTKSGTSQDDIAWMKQNGYTGNAAGIQLPTGFESKTPQQKIEYFNQNNIGADKLLQSGTSQDDIDWMKRNGYTGTAPVAATSITPPVATTPVATTPVAADPITTTPVTAIPVQNTQTFVAPNASVKTAWNPTNAPLELPSGWSGFGATDKINYFNQNNISVDRLLGQGVPQGDIDWMKQNGYKGMAEGGLANLARGGSTGRYLQGETDGMSDEIPTTIDGGRAAALSHGEFVIPADVVSHLGNGNSDAGAKKLYSMMDKLRMARTGTKKQGKQINPDKFMPGGLAAAYANGGKVLGFAEGSTVPAGTTGVNQTLGSWTGSYIPTMLGQAAALANSPYKAYTGPLTAGASGLQNAAFTGAGNLKTPGSIGTAAVNTNALGDYASGYSYDPTSFSNQYSAPTAYNNTTFTSGTFGDKEAQAYMNPYLQQSLNPQIAEARRQSEINALQNNAAMTKAGAYGGGRQAILTSENQRALGSSLANITGQGYNTAYTNAMSQYNQDQARNLQAQQGTEQSKQFGAGQGMTSAQNKAQYGQAAANATEASNQFANQQGLAGLSLANNAYSNAGNLGALQNATNLNNINAQAGLGSVQRGIQSEGMAADQTAFDAARDNPYKMLQFQQSLLNGLPISATNYTSAQPSSLTSSAAGIKFLNDALKTLGLA